jgi:two-component system chemotaxis sensor kinase CheA
VDELDGIVEEFLVESHENLDRLDRDLVQLEASPSSRELLAGIFRTIHTIKGTSGFLAFGNLERLTHVGENLLARMRDGELVLTPARTDVLLQMVDAVRALLAIIERTGKDEGLDVADVVARIEAARAPDFGGAAEEASAEEAPAADAPGQPQQSAQPGPTPEPDQPEASAPVAAPASDEPATPRDEPDPLPVAPAATVPAARVPAPAPAPAPEPEPDPTRRSAVDSSIRVDVAVLDSLMRLVGELVLARNQILQQATTSGDAEAVRSAHRLDLVSAELQEAVMKTRMQSMDYLWSKLPRVVRDLSAQCGKQVELVMEGRETELDRTLLDAVKDPLTHLVRNAVDHGIETADARREAGKRPTGTLTLRAYHASGQVVMEIVDDGRGMDPERILAKAVERELVTAAEARTMTTSEIVDLVFRPGFSTAASVTNVSGRGVGMDVVRTNIEAIGGTVELQSEVGRGCTVKVTIPLTLAIIPALVVRQGSQRYAIPQAQLLELVRMDPEDPTRGVEYVAGSPVHRLRGKLLPLVDVDRVLRMDGAEYHGDEDDPGADRQRTVAVLRADATEFGLVVDEVLDTQEIVVKPLGNALSGIGVFAGAAVMGDGRVALILDVPGLSAEGRIAGTAAELAARGDLASAADRAGGDGEGSYVVLRTEADAMCAVPLASVDRLEEARESAFERLGDFTVMQYHGDLLPVVDLSGGHGGYGMPGHVPAQGGAPGPETVDEPTRPVVVCRTQGRPVGLKVAEVVDIVAVPMSASTVGTRTGTLGSIVVDGRVTEVLDIDHLPYVTPEMLGV